MSHTNANSDEGLDWIENVVAEGLRRGTSGSDWRVEVHSKELEEKDEPPHKGVDLLSDEEDSLGPAVYIIQKIAASEEGGKGNGRGSSEKDNIRTSRVFMKFFAH